MVFHHISKLLSLRKYIYSVARYIFNSLRSLFGNVVKHSLSYLIDIYINVEIFRRIALPAFLFRLATSAKKGEERVRLHMVHVWTVTRQDVGMHSMSRGERVSSCYLHSSYNNGMWYVSQSSWETLVVKIKFANDAVIHRQWRSPGSCMYLGKLFWLYFYSLRLTNISITSKTRIRSEKQFSSNQFY